MQLIKNNNELAIVYNKIRIQESTIYKGRIDYCNHLNEIRDLKLKLNNLKQEHTYLLGTCKNIEVLRHEVHNLRQELMQEKTKVIEVEYIFCIVGCDNITFIQIKSHKNLHL